MVLASSALPRPEFRLTRSFALASGLVLIAAAVLLTALHHSWAIETLKQLAERNNVALTRAFANALWPQYGALAAKAPALDGEALRADPATAALHASIVELMHDLPVAKVKVYDLAGRTIFSTDAAQIGSDQSSNPGFRTASAGRPASEFIFRESFKSFDGEIGDRNLVSSYLPLRPKDAGAPIHGVVEIYSDVTEVWGVIRRDEMMQVAILWGTMAVIYGALLWTVGRAERQLRRQHGVNLALAADKARAESVSQAKSTFLAHMSHELRTPLNAVIGFSDVIKNEIYGPVGNPRYREYAGDIHASGVHLLELINGVLDLSKAEAGKLELRMSPVDVAHVLATELRRLSRQAELAGVELVADIVGTLPAIETDEIKLRQVLLNLLSNAIKFTPRGGTVRLALRAEGIDHIVLEVTDSGIGMSPEDIAVALAPFGQIDSSLARRYQGTGLGLPLAQQFVALLGGRLAIRSAPGAGTCVTVTLPLRPAATTARNATATRIAAIA